MPRFCDLTDASRPQYNGLDISLNMIPPNHPILDPRQLEAEATGLLDRMLGILQDNSRLVHRPRLVCSRQADLPS